MQRCGSYVMYKVFMRKLAKQWNLINRILVLVHSFVHQLQDHNGLSKGPTYGKVHSSRRGTHAMTGATGFSRNKIFENIQSEAENHDFYAKFWNNQEVPEWWMEDIPFVSPNYRSKTGLGKYNNNWYIQQSCCIYLEQLLYSIIILSSGIIINLQ